MAGLNDGVDERTRLLSIPVPISRASEEEEGTVDDFSKVGWDGPHDPQNPKNWRPLQKWTCCILASVYNLIAPAASSMVVPAMPIISHDLGITSATVTQMTLSVFILGYGLGPMIMGPLSELYGRALILHLGQFGFVITNALCGITTEQNSFLFLRLVSGILGSGPMAIGGGILSDLWTSEERGVSLAVYLIAPLLSPTAGPVLGGLILQHHSWRDIFLISSIVSSCVLVLGVLILHETFAPIILHKKRLALVATGEIKDTKVLKTSRMKKLKKVLTVDLARPFILLGTQPIIQMLALYMGLLFGLNHLTISTFHALWRDVYHESDMASSFNYISISLGLIFGSQVTGPVNDRIYNSLKKRNNNIDCPEYRIYLMIPAAILVPVGLLVYGWSASFHLHPFFPNLGIFIDSFGLLMGYQCIQAYTLDCYPTYAASAIGALTVLRGLAGFVLPLIAPAMNKMLGYGWASTVLAGVAAVVGAAAPWLLGTRGKVLREKSPYAAGSVDVVL